MDDKIIRSDAKYRKKPSDPSFHFPPLGNPQRPRRPTKEDTKHVGKRKIRAEERKNKKEDNDVKKLHDVRKLESEKDRDEEKRWVGTREHMRAPTLPTCREMHNTRLEREKRQSSTDKLTATTLPPCSPHGSFTS